MSNSLATITHTNQGGQDALFVVFSENKTTTKEKLHKGQHTFFNRFGQ